MAQEKWRLSNTFAALQHRNFRLFFFGQLVSLTGTWMQQMALSWLVYDLTKSAFLLGLVGMIGSLPMVFFSLPGGVMADRVNKRRVLIFTQTSAMILAFVLAALVFAHLIRVWQIALLAALGGVIFAFDMPARQAFFVEMVGRENLMNAIALNSSIFNGARIVGPALAGILVASLGAGWCFFINGASFLAVIVGLLLMHFVATPRPPRTSSVMEDALGGLRYLRQNRTVLRIAVLMTIFSVFGWIYNVLMPVFAKDVLHSGARGLGYLMTAGGVGALVGSLLIASLGNYPHRWRLLLGGALLLALATGGFAFSNIFLLSCALLAFAGVGAVTLMSSANTMLQLSAPDEMRGRVMGIWGLVFMGSTPLASFLAGTTAHYLGAPFTVGLSAWITGVVALVAIRFARRDKPEKEQSG
jgi:MFS family permease